MTLFKASVQQLTVFSNDNGVFQDGVLAHCQSIDGQCWAILGHTNLGGISIWSGNDLLHMDMMYPAKLLFETGRAGVSYNSSHYPDGPRARGALWPCGLFIHSETGDFYCFFHNETGWGAGDTSYTILGQQEGEPDFRHIGLMRSHDHGRSWHFLDWIITSQYPCWTTDYRPDNLTGGQDSTIVCLGSGDFSIFADHKNGFLYLYYSQSFYHTKTKHIDDAIYVARAPIKGFAASSNWKKWYRGSFCTAGNMGLETPIIKGGNIPSIIYSAELKTFIMSTYHRPAWIRGQCTCQLSYSSDLVHWSKPKRLAENRSDLSKPYFTLYTTCESSSVIYLFMGSNGTDVSYITLLAGE